MIRRGCVSTLCCASFGYKASSGGLEGFFQPLREFGTLQTWFDRLQDFENDVSRFAEKP